MVVSRRTAVLTALSNIATRLIPTVCGRKSAQIGYAMLTPLGTGANCGKTALLKGHMRSCAIDSLVVIRDAPTDAIDFHCI